MFDIGFQEMLLVAVLVIVFIPADDLPEMMRTLGRYYAKIRRASDDLRRAFNAEVARTDADRRRDDLAKRRERAGVVQAPMPDTGESRPGTAILPETAPLPDETVIPPDPRFPADAAPRKAQD